MKNILSYNDTKVKIPKALYELIMRARDNKFCRIPRKEIEALQKKNYKTVSIVMLDTQDNTEDGKTESQWSIDEYVGEYEDGETIEIVYTID